MNFDEYQKRAIETAIYPPGAKVVYPALGLASEAGEVAGKVKKWLRDDNPEILNEDRRQAIIDELGDVLWYCAALAEDIGVNLSHVANRNLEKLRDRDVRGMLKGSGDNR